MLNGMGRKSPHTSTNPGKRVRLVLRDGSQVEGCFKERTGQFIVLEEGRFRGRDVDKFIVVKSAANLEEGYEIEPPPSASRSGFRRR